MAAPRLSDAQREELVERFRSGAGTQALAEAYGCSPNTVTRVVRAAIEPAVYEELKRQRSRRAAQAPQDGDPTSLLSDDPQAEPGAPTAAEATGSPATAAAPPSFPSVSADPDPVAAAAAPAAPGAQPDQEDDDANEDALSLRPGADERETAMELAIDDADDFDGLDDDSEEEDDDEDDDTSAIQTFVEVPVALHEVLDQPVTTARPWSADEMPASAYMLVDKTVELQARPLADIPELGRLEAEELELQALVLYSNPRQAKRQCGRTQRVIKVPDVGVLERTAPYLRRQGIRRVVLEGSLYALPEA